MARGDLVAVKSAVSFVELAFSDLLKRCSIICSFYVPLSSFLFYFSFVEFSCLHRKFLRDRYREQLRFYTRTTRNFLLVQKDVFERRISSFKNATFPN